MLSSEVQENADIRDKPLIDVFGYAFYLTQFTGQKKHLIGAMARRRLAHGKSYLLRRESVANHRHQYDQRLIARSHRCFRDRYRR